MMQRQIHANKLKRKSGAGFIALTSAIIISAILLVVTITGSLTSFYTRYNILDAELKERSSALADACVDAALLNLANDSSYTGGADVTVDGSNTCHIYPSLNGTGDPRMFVAQGKYQRAYTSIEFSVDVDTLAIQSWQEIPTYP